MAREVQTSDDPKDFEKAFKKVSGKITIGAEKPAGRKPR
jgi:hypothetical protein